MQPTTLSTPCNPTIAHRIQTSLGLNQMQKGDQKQAT